MKKIINVNLLAPILLTKIISQKMIKRKSGSIINIGSIFGHVSKSQRSSYSATKSGLEGFTRAASLDLAKYGVLVNSVCPGFVKTDLTRKVLGLNRIKQLQKEIPLGRLSNSEEIVNLVLFLSSNKNTYITGQSFIIDGGLLLNKVQNKIKITSKMKNYEVFFEDNFDKILKEFPIDSVLIVDQNLKKKLEKKIRKKKFKILYITASEKIKSFEKIDEIIKKLIKISVNKTTTVVAIGGGTIQDLVAFISSIFLEVSIGFLFLQRFYLSVQLYRWKTSINFYGIKKPIRKFLSNIQIEFSNFNAKRYIKS